MCALCTLTLLNSSCTTMYVPNAVPTPLLTEKGDSRIDVGVGLSQNVQASYALTDHLGLMVNGLYQNVNSSTNSATELSEDGDGIYRISRFVEGGLGYYTLFNDEDGVFEVYTGFGKGETFDNKGSLNPTYDPKTLARYSRVFIQPNVGIVRDHMEFCMGVRLSNVNFDDVLSESSELNQKQFKFGMIEPAITIKAGWPYAKFFTQYSFMIPISNSNKDYYRLNSNPVFSLFSIRVGMSFRINPFTMGQD